MKPRKFKRPRRAPSLYVIHGGHELGRDEGAALLANAYARIESRRMVSRAARIDTLPTQRRSVERAMLAVEKAIVDAYWILARSTHDPLPREPRQHGIGYMLEREDKWGQAVASGGWLSQPMLPSPPTAAEIDWADKPLEWLQLLDEEHRAVVSAGARSKRGDVGRHVSWIRVKAQNPALSNWTPARLRRNYYEGLRIIAAEVKL